LGNGAKKLISVVFILKATFGYHNFLGLETKAKASTRGRLSRDVFAINSNFWIPTFGFDNLAWPCKL
jgi:hypothetical protein